MVTIDARFNESPDSAHGGVPFGVLGLGASKPLLAEGLHDTPFRSPTRNWNGLCDTSVPFSPVIESS